MNLMSKHIPTEKLINFADGTLPGGETGKVKAHLTECKSCAKEVKLFSKVVNLMRSDGSVEAPTGSIVWAKNLFRTRALMPRQTVTQKILAVLQMDLSQMSPAFGERSAAATSQILFHAGENSVDLRVLAGEKGLTVKGQILGGGFENCAVTLAGGKKKIDAESNELAEFTLTGIKPGTYQMTLKSGAKEIVLEDLVLK